MKTEFKAKFLQHLAQKRQSEGFTLIELLVVVIIIGVLAAIALPNLLAQVGKARESELKNTVGTINRAQQAYHFERQIWGTTTNDLGVTVTLQYQEAPTLAGTASGSAFATVITNAANFATNGTRAYSGGTGFAAATGDYSMIVCGSTAPAQNGTAPSNASTCAGTTTQIR